jgi:hypothetical protein
MDIYLTMKIPERAAIRAPKGFRHWRMEESSHYIEWGLFLLLGMLRVIFIPDRYKGKHERIGQTWHEKLAQKIDDVDMARDLLVNIIFALGNHLRRSLHSMKEDLRKSVQKFWQVIFGKVFKTLRSLKRKAKDAGIRAIDRLYLYKWVK